MRISDWSSDVCSSDLIIVAVQFLDQFQQFILADCRWAAEFHAFHAHLDSRLALVPNIDAAGRILTHQHHRESGLSARLRRKGLHPRGHLFAQLRGKGLAIDNPSDSHASHRSEEHTSELQSLMPNPS